MARRSCLHILVASFITTTALFLWIQRAPRGPWYDRLSESLPDEVPFLGNVPKPHYSPSDEHLPPTPPSKWKLRQDEVREAFLHAYTGYKLHSLPADELLPLSGGSANKFNNWSVTLFDSLDTMLIMGLQDEYKEALAVVAKQEFSMASHEFAPFFETVIRYLGGVLSAYAMTKHPILLERADQLGQALLPAFKKHESGLPTYSVNTINGRTAMSGSHHFDVLLAEVASCQLEYKYLAKLTGKKEYYSAVENVMEKLYAMNATQGLFPTRITMEGKPASRHFSIGAGADSAYEYFLKQWLQSGDKKALDQYLVSIDGIMNNLLFVSPSRKLLYVTDVHAPYVVTKDFDLSNLPTDVKPSYVATDKLEHLSCFLPGLFILGASTIPSTLLPPSKKQMHEWAARGLTYTCYLTYADQSSGLGPDELTMQPGGEPWTDAINRWVESNDTKFFRKGSLPGLREGGKVVKEGRWGQLEHSELYRYRDYWNSRPEYKLRPETVESLYLLWRVTKEAKWRERGWEIFQSIQTKTKTHIGYASVNFVDMAEPRLMDDMPSYFLAETLKYLYLLFGEEDPFPADKWVFNTEAHPLPRFTWTDVEKAEFGIQ